MSEGRAFESNQQEAARCKRCLERNDDWNQNLTLNDHGCSACKKVFDASAWNWKVIKNHREHDRDLVCEGCTERGYAPGRYEEHKCEECLEIFGSLKFDRKNKYNMTRVQSGRLVCQECMTSLQCSSCKKRYELKYWGKHERKNHHSRLKTKLICKACRAQGFTAWSVEAYTCHTCSCKFGPNKFATFALQNVGIVKYSISWAPWPLKRRCRPEAARRCLRGDVCTEMSAQFWLQWSQNCADISVQTSPRRHLRAASGRGRLFRGHGANETLKIVLPDVLVSSHRIVAAMLLTGASCGMVMTIIPWVAGISEWMHFHLHARLLHAACQVYPPLL